MMRSRLSTYLHIMARLAFAATIVALPFRVRLVLAARPLGPVYTDYTNWLLFPSDVFMIATLAFWLFGLALNPRRLVRGLFFLFWPILGVTGVGIASIVFSVDPLLSSYHSVRLALLLGLYLYVVNEIKTLNEIVLPVGLQVLIQATVGIAQALRQHSVDLWWLGEYTLDPAIQGISVVVAGDVRALRVYGLTDHPNILGGCLAFALLVIAAWYLTSDTRWRALASSLFALGAVGLLLTFSRSAWVAMSGGVILAAALLLKTRQTRALSHGLGLLGATLIVMVPFAWQNAGYLGVRLNQNNSFTRVATENRSITERSVLLDAAIQILAGHTWTGVGLGAFPTALRGAYSDFPFDYQPPHIVLLDVAAEIGIFGALFYLIIMLGPWLALWRNRRRLTFSPALIGVSGALLAVTLVGFFDYYTWLITPGRLWQWLVWGLWGAVYQSSLSGATNA
jgi:O-antigen ligase